MVLNETAIRFTDIYNVGIPRDGAADGLFHSDYNNVSVEERRKRLKGISYGYGIAEDLGEAFESAAYASIAISTRITGITYCVFEGPGEWSIYPYSGWKV